MRIGENGMGKGRDEVEIGGMGRGTNLKDERNQRGKRRGKWTEKEMERNRKE